MKTILYSAVMSQPKGPFESYSAIFLQREKAEFVLMPPLSPSFEMAGKKIKELSSYSEEQVYSIQTVSPDGSQQISLATYGYKTYALTLARRMTDKLSSLRPLIDNPYIAVDPIVFSYAEARSRGGGSPCVVLRGQFMDSATAQIRCDSGHEARAMARRINHGFERFRGQAKKLPGAELIYPEAFGFGKK